MKVLIFGGTHGNEWTGIYAIQKYAETFKAKYPSLKMDFILANPEAFKVNKRFTEEDLNRAFQYLDEKRTTYEHNRAREIRDLINKEDTFVIDLHTTTSNMGKTVILTDYNPLTLFVGQELSQRFSDCRIIGSPDPKKKYLASQTTKSLMIEVGPVANGVIDPVVLESTIDLLDATFSVLAKLPKDPKGEVVLYEEVEDIYYPKNENGEINGYIHAELQGNDFQKILGNYPAFKKFSGETMSLNCSEERYPIFINEAAYYPQQLAFTLCKKTLRSF